MTLLHRLENGDYKDGPFCRYSNPVNVDFYETIRCYIGEIRGARDRGYGWGQISAALRDELADNGRWRPEWTYLDLAEYFSLLVKNTCDCAASCRRHRRR